MSKKLIIPLLVTGVAFSTFARPNGTVAVGSLPGAAIGMQAGDHNFTIDTINQNMVMDVLVKLNENQKKLAQETVDQISEMITSLVENEIMGDSGLRKLSDDSVTGTIPMVVYQASVRSYEKAKIAIGNKMKGLLSIPQMVNSSGTANLGTKSAGKIGKQNLAVTNVDFAPISRFFDDQLKKIDSGVVELRFRINHPTLGLKNVQGISERLEAVVDAKLLDEQLKEANRLLAVGSSPAVQRSIDGLALFTRRHIDAMTESFGTTQRFRLDLNDEGMQSAMKDLEEMFFMRSFMRKFYGTGIGAIGIDYRKRMLNLDFITTSNKINWMANVVRNRNEMVIIQDKIYNALITADSRSQEILKKETPMLSRLSSLATKTIGQSSLAAINTFVLSLVAADIQEELILTKADGYKAFRAHYAKRYYKTAEEKAAAKELEASLLGEGELTTQALEISADTPRGNFNLAMNSGLLTAFNSLEQGRRLLTSVKAIQGEQNGLINSMKKNALKD